MPETEVTTLIASFIDDIQIKASKSYEWPEGEDWTEIRKRTVELVNDCLISVAAECDKMAEQKRKVAEEWRQAQRTYVVIGRQALIDQFRRRCVRRRRAGGRDPGDEAMTILWDAVPLAVRTNRFRPQAKL